MPETFTATLNVTKDYRYTFEYDGLIAFGPAIGEIAQHGSLPKKADDDMREGTANTFKKEEGFDHASYQGKGRWKVHFKKNGAITDTANLFGDGLPIVTLRRTAGGNVSIEGMTVDPKIAQQLRDVHFVIDGNLEVTTDMTVVSHNATETPKLLGLIGHYGWKISSEHLTSPVMKLGPSPAALAELQRQQDLARLATTESSSRRATAASRDSHGPGSTGRRGGSRERGG